MANPGVGSKFVSVNLNKSYGQRQNSSGNIGTSRSRSGGNGVGGGSGSGMVVLSRSRSSIVGVQKGGPKLSVPPPLNLPSLRKEHERFDSSSSGGGSAGSGNSGPGARPASSGIGWTKPSPLALQEKDIGNDHPLFERSGVGSPRIDVRDPSLSSLDRISRGNSVYMPPSARSGMVGPSVVAPTHDFLPVQKAVVLRGEDFPSLQATLPSSSGVAQKQKDNLNQKQNEKVSGESGDEQMGNSYLRPPFAMHPQNQSSRLYGGKASDDNGVVNHRSGGSRNSEQFRKQDNIFPSPLPLVWLNHTSDWADDERDTGHGLPDRDRDNGYLRTESHWDRDFDLPRGSIPRTSVHDLSDGRGLRHDEVGKPSSGGFLRGNTYNRDVRTPSREGRDGSSWRSSTVTKDGFRARDGGFDRNGVGLRPLGMNREMSKENKYGQSPLGDIARDGFSSGISSQDSRYGRKDMGNGQGSRQTGNHMTESYSGRGVEQTKLDPYGGDLSNRHRGDFFQNGSLLKSSGKGSFVNDPILNVSREKCLTSGKQYMDDPFLKDFGSGPSFDARDPLTGTLVGVLKRKKDVLKQVEFHDPVRESFEAELERVQKLQEQERQRVIEEQERALELARKEEEERVRLAREEEERRRRLEEEAREATWRAEQERLEAVRKAEELRMAREEERRRIQLEEERRKEAARRKLLELEARIARRQAEMTKDNEYSAGVRDERMLGVVQEKDVPRVADVVDWEDGERMVERITSSASSDSSSLNRSFDSRSHFYRDGDSAFLDRGKPANSWRRDVLENGNSSTLIWQDQENGYRNPRRDAFGAGRTFPRKEVYGGPGAMPAKTSSRGGIPDPHMVDDFPHPRGHRWNLAGDGDHYSRNSEVDPEYHDNFGDKISDMGWGLVRSHGSHHASYPERLYQNSETDGFSSYGKSRHSMRQPRVLPPPSLASMHKNTFRDQILPPGSSGFLDSEIRYHHAPTNSEPILQTGYETSYQVDHEQPRVMDSQKENTISRDQKAAKSATPRCDSQSSLSVSSPPSSPTHLSHDELEDSGESPSLATAAEEEVHLSDDENTGSVADVGNTSKAVASSPLSPVEDEEWDFENHQELPEQDEYDEEENGYREEDEVHEEDDGNVDLPQEFEDLHLEEKGSSSKIGQLDLSFDESGDVVMPSGDDFERTSMNEEKTIEIQQVSAGVSEEPGSLDGLVGIGQNLQSGNNLLEVSAESSKVIHETEKTLLELGLQPASAVHSSAASADYLLDSVEASGTSNLPHEQPLASSVNLALPAQITQPTMSTVSSGQSQTEVPIKLQFGLFSGPSLIPSPVPAIQIGSIPMPLHLHPQVGPSVTQLHPSQPPFFQFGQLRYASPISQGILPVGPQSMSFVQPSVPAHYSLNQNQESSIDNQEGQDGVQKLLDQSQEDPGKEVNVMSVRQGAGNEVLVSHSREDCSVIGERKLRVVSTSPVDPGYQYLDGKKNYRSIINNKESQSQLQAEPSTSQFISRAPGTVSGNRGKRFIYTVKNSRPRPLNPVSEYPQTDFRGSQRRGRQKVQRTEFRVRENVDKRQTEGFVSSNYLGSEEKSSFSGRVSGNLVLGGGKEAFVNKPSKQMIESESLYSDSFGARGVDSESKMEMRPGQDVSTKKSTSLNISRSKEGNLKRNNSSDEDVDAPLQSGIVRVFKQPGIEAPSDEDDFIEVRSKRQMLNDRREQREKEINAKSRVLKAPRKRRSFSQNNVASTISNKMPTSLGGEAADSTHSKSVISDCQGLVNVEGSTRFTKSIASPPLAPIGTPSVNTDAHADIRPYTTISHQTNPKPVISTGGTSLVSSLSFEKKNMALDSVPTSLGPWGNARMNQQVMALTQTQLDEAMKPARFDTHVASIGDHTITAIEPNKLSSSIVTQDKSFSSSSSPLNSLLAGERIQFGAVTSPTILLPRSHVVSNGMGPPGSCRSDVSIDHNLSTIDNDCSLFFEKEKHLSESCVDLEDSEAEAEAEAAASAVAVAAISSDDIVGNGCSVSVSDTKSFSVSENQGLASEGGVSNGQLASQSRVEESLSVALPADLSVETPSLSLWPSLPSPQHSSGQMLSHFSGGPPSHFPCYEMNPMLGGPIFAFGPHDESAGTQSQSQKSNASGLGAWQQCHSGVDSFYGPRAGFTGPFISSSGGIPGVQGPPHMVVYNHFTPVGQFGQVGLSFMGATYIPSGKQPDWKHNPTSSAMGIGEGDINNLSVASGQRNPPSIPAPIQHLAPGSPLMPLASPLAMFDMSPFQSSTDVPVQARWSHFSASPLHSASLSMPLQQHAEGILLPSQFSHESSMDQSTGNRFHEPCSAPTSDSGRNFPVETDATVTQFPDELGLVDTSSTTATRVSASRPTSYSSSIMNGKSQTVGTKSLSRTTVANAGDNGSIHNHGNSNSSNQSANTFFKTQSTQHQSSSTQQYLHPTGYTYQRGDGIPQRVGSGGEWSHRRMGFQGRNQSSGPDKKLASSKVKQIYVAKPASSSRTSTAL